MSEPIKWINNDGKTRWQPVLDNGERRYYHGRETCWAKYSDIVHPRFTPTNTTYRRAVRLARREQRRRDRRAWREDGE